MTTAEIVTTVAPLGVRFRDPHTGRAVSDLAVIYAGSGGDSILAHVNRRGVYVIDRPAGLREALRGRGDAEYWHAPPERASVRLTVADPRGRYIGYECALATPRRGLVQTPCGSPPEEVEALPLFSAPQATPPPGLAVIRAELHDGDGGRPAAGAMVEADAGGQAVARGVADHRGRLLIALPLPPVSPAIGSPPGGRGLLAQTWSVALRAWWTPGAAPDLCGLLAQRPAVLLGTVSPPAPLGPQLLRYGRELVVRTQDEPVLHLIPTAP